MDAPSSQTNSSIADSDEELEHVRGDTDSDEDTEEVDEPQYQETTTEEGDGNGDSDNEPHTPTVVYTPGSQPGPKSSSGSSEQV